MLKKRSGCHPKPRHSAKSTTNKSLKPTNPAHDDRTHSTANETAKEQACGVREAPHRDQLTTNLNTEMKKLFVAVTIACLGTILISVSAHAARNLAFDDKGNLFVADTDSILKFTSDGKKSTFATGINPGDLVFDRAGNLFVTDPGSDSILKFTPDGKKSTFATEISDPGDMAFDAAGNLFVSGSGLIFKFTPDGTRSTLVSDRVSPDKQWEYHSAERERIVKAGTSQTVLDLSEELPDLENAKIVWAPDSKRVAF